MFFHTLLLQPQHSMQLGLPWIAATLGVNKLKKNEILQCNVDRICAHILSFVTSNSLNPNKRFSLRLSAFLINGTCKILRQQVIYLQGDIDNLILARERAASRLLKLEDSETETPLTPQPRIKKKKTPRRPSVETPESLVQIRNGAEPAVPAVSEFTLQPMVIQEIPEEEAAILQSRADEITLREEQPRPQETLWDDDFGAREIQPPRPTAEAVEVTVVADVHVPPKSPRAKKRKSPKKVSKKEQEVVVPQIEVEEVQIPQAAPVEEIQIEQPAAIQTAPDEVPPPIQATPEEVPPPIQVAPEEVSPSIQVAPEEVPPPVQEAPEEVLPPIQGVPEEVLPPIQVEREEVPTAMEAMRPPPTPRRERRISPAVLMPEPVEVPKIYGIPVHIFLLHKTRRTKKFVNINRELNMYHDKPDFTLLITDIPPFVLMSEFSADLEIEMPPTPTAPRQMTSTGTLVGSQGSLTLGIGETPEPSVSLALPAEASSVATSPGSRLVSTPRKRPLPSEETIEEILAPAANGAMGPPQKVPKRSIKAVSVKEGRAEISEVEPQVPLEPAVPLEPVVVPLEPEIPLEPVVPLELQVPLEPEVQVEIEVMAAPQVEVVGEALGRLEEESERPSVEVSPPRPGREADAFGIKWSGRIMRVVNKHGKITPVKICKAIGQRLTKLNMSIIFAALLALAKNRYVLLHSAENSIELKTIEQGPVEYNI